ncbi:MAG: sensor domain-containing diguanylate cyclase [Burkholderiaceae bacterium]
MPSFAAFWKRHRLLIRLGVLLVLGFLTTSIAGYIVSRDTTRRDIAERGLPLTGDTIYSEIQKDILRPTFISSLMAQDTFVRDWVLHGETDSESIVRYLGEIKRKYGTVTSFLVSNRSGKYYYAGGTLKAVDPQEPRDEWFYRVRDMREPYEINVDYDMANHDAVTIFVNYRVLDYHGNFIGATGVGLTLDSMGQVIDHIQQRFHRSVYFVAPDGRVIAAGNTAQGRQGSIHTLPGLATVADRILNRSTEPTRLEYTQGHAKVLVNSRFIPELGWYLVVSQNESEAVQPLLRVFVANLAISAAVTLLVLALTLLAVNRFRRQLETAAQVDAMTGMLNRQAFELIFEQARSEARRNRQPMSLILIDIDLFKRINDGLGHLAGDQVIRAVAALIQATVRGNDVIGRWGGEEFLLLLKDCRQQQALTIAEKLRQAIAARPLRFGDAEVAVSASMGTAEYVPEEPLAAFFARADAALYRAKQGGRNRVEASAG